MSMYWQRLCTGGKCIERYDQRQKCHTKEPSIYTIYSLNFLSSWIESASMKEAYFWARGGFSFHLRIDTGNNFLIVCHGMDTGYASLFVKIVLLPACGPKPLQVLVANRTGRSCLKQSLCWVYSACMDSKLSGQTKMENGGVFSIILCPWCRCGSCVLCFLRIK